MVDVAIAIDRLRLRGPGAGRLASVAARALPAALERALADLGDVRVEQVHVVLDLDPADYDDETLAVIWADLIRAEVLGVVGPTSGAPTAASGPRGSAAGRSSEAVAETDPPSLAVVVEAARRWLAASPAVGTPVPAPLLALADPALAGEVAAALGATTWAALTAALERVVPPARPGRRAEAGPDRTPTDPPTVTPPGTALGEPADVLDPAPRRTAEVDDAATSAAADPDGRVPEQVLVLAELHAGDSRDLDPATVTRAAGLVLLYPWLADHCRLAESLHPGLDPVAVREAALAALVGEPTLVDDPLVGLLAGRATTLAPTRVDRVPLLRVEEVVASGDRVLAAFAHLLPGFGESTPEFVRDAWLVRLGVLDLDRDPTTLVAATHPLDVLLPMLPYPLGLLKLPWSPMLAVRFRP